MAKSIALSIRLIPEEFDDEKDILKSGAEVDSTKIKGGMNGTIYFQTTRTKAPKWLPQLNSIAANNIARLFNAQASALMLLKVQKRYFAISFGSGWSWLEPSSIERRFGLLVALNCIDDEQIKVVDAQQIDSMALSRRSQVSHSTEIAAFGLDASRDLMRAVMGKPKDVNVGKNITGADALRLVCKIDFSDLDKKCAQLFELYNSKTYRERYGWIDNIEMVKNPSEISRLNKLLVESINKQETERLFLSPPRIRDIQADEDYILPFSQDRKAVYDLEIDELLPRMRDKAKGKVSLDTLKKNYIEVVINDATVDKFSIYSALIFELRDGKDLLCLIDSSWFKVASNHVADVDGKIKAIAASKLKLPKAKNKEKEGDYNLRAAKELKILCLDKKLVQYGGGSSKIEICDLMTKTPEFIHVKRTGGSQILSHLFNQGVVSGQSLIDPPFRKKCEAHIVGEYAPLIKDAGFKPANSKIVFALITEKPDKIPNGLPFFSKQTLVNANDQLVRYGYKVEVLAVPSD